MDNKIEIGLGVKVRDKVSGLVGIVDSMEEKFGAATQWAVQPEGDGKTKPDGYMVDAYQLEVVDAGISVGLPPIDTSVTIVLGNKVRDIASDIEGFALGKITFLNGCVHFTIITKDSGKKEAAYYTMPHKRLKIIGKGLAPVEPKKKTPVPAKPPGGPTTRISDRNMF